MRHSAKLAAIALSFLPGLANAQDVADTIYSGGPILTINDGQPKVEAVAVKDGRILAAGTLADISTFKGETTETFDLNGRTMLPGFVDSHGHVVMGGIQALSANLLAPPDGDVTDIASLQATLKAWAETNAATVDKGSIEVGKLADFVLLSEDPTAIDPEKLAGIKIEGTVKGGNLVYDAQKDSRRGDLSPQFPVFGNPEAAHHLMHAMYDGLSGASNQ